MSSFKEFVQRFNELAAHKPKAVNIGREMQVMRATGSAAGENIEAKSQIMHSFVPIVKRTYRILLRQGVHPTDIEEFLLDSLRLAVLFTNEEGELRGGMKQRMSTTEFVARTQRKRRAAKRKEQDKAPPPEEAEQEPESPDEFPPFSYH